MEIANREMFEAWDGEDGDDWTENAERYEQTSLRLEARLTEPSILSTGDRVLDIGCGTGRTTIEAAQRASQGSALGVDLSSRMLGRAREQAAAHGVDNVAFLQADAQVHPFEPEAADVAISSFGAMFFGDPVAAFTNIANGLRPGGRLALLAWRELDRNEWLRTIRGALALGRDLPTPPPDAPTPFSLADPGRVQARLTSARFGDIDLEPVDEPLKIGSDAEDAFEFFQTQGIVRGLLNGVDDAGRAEALDNLHRAFKEAETSEGVLLGSSVWLITAVRG